MVKYDFSGWATRNDILCADGRTIRKDAFKANDGQTVPLLYGHCHNDPDRILGHALLENRDEGVYAYCTFNESESGKAAKEAVRHGDVKSLSIYANKLKQSGNDVLHGMIREVSIVMAGANPGAFIDSVMMHGEDTEEGVICNYDENIMIHYYTEDEEPLQHAEDKKEDEKTVADRKEEKKEEVKAETKEEAKTETKEEAKAESKEEAKAESKEKTVGEVWEGILAKTTEEEQTVMYALIGQALNAAPETDEDDDKNDKDENVKHSDGGNEIMHKNVFDREETAQGTFLSHADEQEILSNARAAGSFKKGVEMWGNDHLEHGFGAAEGETIDVLFRDVQDAHPGAPGLLERDMDWVFQVMSKAHKSPAARVRTRHIDARIADLTAKAHKKGEQKKLAANVKLLKRETHPQTVYIKDALHRDDILDIDFDSVAYMRNIMKHTLEETVALAALVGDIRNEDADKISDQNIRPIWTDDELYVIHESVDITAAKAALQGTDTAVHFGDNYIYAEAIITAAMNARVKYKGKGTPDFYCEPNMLNIMLLARDLNGRRIYESKADLAKVLNVNNIFTVEQFAELDTRKDEEDNEFKLLGIFVNMANYQFGCAKGGEITSFEDFDIDYNQYKYLMETRLSGALIDPYSAIVLEEPVAAG